jgi:Flp pilus assembly pilin Flp
MKKLIKRLWHEEEGGDLSEYALLIVLVSLVAMIAIVGGGAGSNHAYSNAQANTAASS